MERQDSGWAYVGTTPVNDPGHQEVSTYEVEAHAGHDLFGYDRMCILATPVGVRNELEVLRVTIDRCLTSNSKGAQVANGMLASEVLGHNLSHLRSLPIGRLLSQAALDVFGVERADESDGEGPPEFAELRAEWPDGDTERVAKWVGWLYQRAVMTGDPATKAVQDAMAVSRRTAQRMIGVARERGYLPAEVVSASGRSRKRKGQHDEQDKADRR